MNTDIHTYIYKYVLYIYIYIFKIFGVVQTFEDSTQRVDSSKVWKKPKYNSKYIYIKLCQLCLNEKLEIAAYKEQNLLDKRNEIVSKCRHQLKYPLARFDTKDWDDVRLIETTIL